MNKICTSLEQSKKLIELGIDVNTADMQWVNTGYCMRVLPVDDYEAQSSSSTNPAWSEEDEEMVNLSLVNLTELKDRFREDYGRVGKCISWLELLKERLKG